MRWWRSGRAVLVPLQIDARPRRQPWILEGAGVGATPMYESSLHLAPNRVNPSALRPHCAILASLFPVPAWSDSDVDELISSYPVHGPTACWLLIGKFIHLLHHQPRAGYSVAVLVLLPYNFLFRMERFN